MTAWRAGWRAFWARPDVLLIPVLVASVAWVIVEFAVQATLSGTVTRSHPCLRYVAGLTDPTRCAADADTRILGNAIGLYAFLVLGLVFWAVLVHVGLAALGTPAPRRPVAVLGTALLGGLALTLGLGLGILPGLVLGFLGQFTIVIVVAEQVGPIAGFGRSVLLVVRNPGPVTALTALALLALGAGLLLLIAGVFPALAIVLLAQLHLHRDASA